MLMADTRLSLSEITGPIKDLLGKLEGKNGREWLDSLKKFLRKQEVSRDSSSLIGGSFRHVRKVKIPAMPRFIPKDHFNVSNQNVRIRGMDKSFQDVFLNKIEDAQGESILTCYRSTRDISKFDAIVELGKGYKTTLAQLWNLLERQPAGMAGVLYGGANFFICDLEGVPWIIDVKWSSRSNGWHVFARAFTDAQHLGWSPGFLFYSQ
jgi:hypothetical protein